MPTPEELADLEEAMDEIREHVKEVSEQATWDEDELGPVLNGQAGVNLTIGISNARNPVEAAEAMLDILIRKGADEFVLSVVDRATSEEYLVYQGRVVTEEQVKAIFKPAGSESEESEGDDGDVSDA